MKPHAYYRSRLAKARLRVQTYEDWNRSHPIKVLESEMARANRAVKHWETQLGHRLDILARRQS